MRSDAGGSGPDRRPWSVIQHVDIEGPGAVATLATERGIELRTVVPSAGEGLPPVAELGGLVVMGGPMGVGDDAVHPWLAAERALLAEAVAAGRPVLAVCLGAQQLAAALGARVYAAAEPEIGTGSVVLTSAGRRDRVFGPEYGGLAGDQVPCFHWHQDTFDLPPRAVHLAATSRCPHQAFRVGRVCYGLQFHVELDDALAVGWRAGLPDGVELPPADVQRIGACGHRLLSRFFDLALAERPA